MVPSPYTEHPGASSPRHPPEGTPPPNTQGPGSKVRADTQRNRKHNLPRGLLSLGEQGDTLFLPQGEDLR